MNLKQDQNGNVHAYFFDGMGRPVSDQVPTLGPGVDGFVRRIDTAYEIRGMVNAVTSYEYGGAPIGSVSMTFDAFEQLETDSQSPAGGATLTVGYAYADGSANTIRRTSITYPYSTGSRTLDYNYTGDDDSLSRVTSLAFAGGTVAAYAYFGLASVASTTPAGGAFNSTLATIAPAYPGLDIFGRWSTSPGQKPRPAIWRNWPMLTSGLVNMRAQIFSGPLVEGGARAPADSVLHIAQWLLDGAAAQWLPPRGQAGFPTSRSGNSDMRSAQGVLKTIGHHV